MNNNIVNVEIVATQEQLAEIELDYFDFSKEQWVAWDFGIDEWPDLGPCAKVNTELDESAHFIIPESFLKRC
jgi:hypothetical protein